MSMNAQLKAFTDWREINSRPKFNILTELNNLREENKKLKERVKKLVDDNDELRSSLPIDYDK